MQTIPLPKPPKAKELSATRGVFEIEECYPGYGVTLGNALRRVLLSSLEGAAITNVKIKGATHEFSTIPYVMEDVIQLILNLKKVRFFMHKEGEVRAKLSVKGEKEVKAKDIVAGSSLEVVNGDQLIARLTDKKAELEIELLIEKGIGYQMAEERDRKERELGVIEIDTLYSPVTRVNIETENMRVGKQTDFERLRLTIETDGTVKPDEALSYVAAILVRQFSEITTPQVVKAVEKGKIVGEKTELGKKSSNKEAVSESEEDLTVPEEEEMALEMSEEEILEMPIQKLKMPSRTSNLLVEQNFKKVGDLAILSEEEILKIEGMGDKGLRDIKKALGNFGLVLENDEEKELKKKQKN
jgi:DNA-directed RNA polymerase subunit alpha